MAHDVFISYSSKNKVIADALCHYLEEHHIRCWIAPRDIPPGDSYADQIDSAITNCKVFVFIFSKDSAESQWCSKEIDIGLRERIILIPFRIDDHPLQKRMRLYLGDRHWIDACPEPHLLFGTLCNSILAFMGRENSTVSGIPASVLPSSSAAPVPPPESAGKKKKIILTASLLAAGVLLLASGAILSKTLFSSEQNGGKSAPSAVSPAVSVSSDSGSGAASIPVSELANELKQKGNGGNSASTEPITPQQPESMANAPAEQPQESASAATPAITLAEGAPQPKATVSPQPPEPAETKDAPSESAAGQKPLTLHPGTLLSIFIRERLEETLDPNAVPMNIIVDNNAEFDITSLRNDSDIRQTYTKEHNRNNCFAKNLFLVWEGYFQADEEDTYSFSLINDDTRRLVANNTMLVYFGQDKEPSLSVGGSRQAKKNDSCRIRIGKGFCKIRIVWRVYSENYAPPSVKLFCNKQNDPSNRVAIKPSNLYYESSSK